MLTMLTSLTLSSSGQFGSPMSSRQDSVNPDLEIQVGAFRHESYSSVLKEKLSVVLDKPVIVVVEDGFYKVRITGFSSEDEMSEFYSALSFLGLKNFWALPFRKKEELVPLAAGQQDSTLSSAVERNPMAADSAENPDNSPTSIVLQVDVFHNKSEALDARKKIVAKLNLPVEVVQEWEYFKVFVTGFQSSEEANKYFNAIAKLGFPKISLIKNYQKK